MAVGVLVVSLAVGVDVGLTLVGLAERVLGGLVIGVLVGIGMGVDFGVAMGD